ncbi:biotin-dependent carboxyltransferase family protein [Maribacter sp. 2307ULW6-5]|uniref:5-oxoprolinase subunit C family protein n=1 Tax=Maribacter sp. 2307ULW6-5 TaxID=3386275 RepID=UPI0039BC5ADA
MIKVLKPGFFTTVQDLGRFHYRHKGVPVSGAMDGPALERANLLLENDPSDAGLEMTMGGPTLSFMEPTYFALAGALMSATLNNVPVANDKVYRAQTGDILSYGRLEKGFRAYLAVKGGFRTPLILGSRSWYSPITPANCLREGDQLAYGPVTDFEPKISEMRVHSHLEQRVLEVSPAPEFERVPRPALQQLFGTEFTLAKENNRMAYQLEEVFVPNRETMLTAATLPGTVQWTPAGKLILLMKDGQTTGGYPRILQLSQKAIGVLAQKRTGDRIAFALMEK